MIERRQLADALPSDIQVRGVTPQGALVLEPRGRSGQLYIVRALDGRVIAGPDSLLGSLFSETLFEHAHLDVRDVSFAPRDRTLLVRASARVR